MDIDLPEHGESIDGKGREKRTRAKPYAQLYASYEENSGISIAQQYLINLLLMHLVWELLNLRKRYLIAKERGREEMHQQDRILFSEKLIICGQNIEHSCGPMTQMLTLPQWPRLTTLVNGFSCAGIQIETGSIQSGSKPLKRESLLIQEVR
jgi:hypothetical protein